MVRVKIRKSLRRSDFDFVDLPLRNTRPRSQSRSESPRASEKEFVLPKTTSTAVEEDAAHPSADDEFVLDEEEPFLRADEPDEILQEADADVYMEEADALEQSASQALPEIQMEAEDLSGHGPTHTSWLEEGGSPTLTPEPAQPDVCGEQLGWILEHLARTEAIPMADAPFNDLVSLLCDDELQPKQVPIYLLATAITRVFRNDLRLCNWPAVHTALQQFEQVERRLQRHLAALAGHAMQKYVGKERTALAQMFRYLHIGLRRWAVIHEVMKRKTSGHALVLINVLFPAQLSRLTLAAERGMTEDVAKHRKALIRFASGVQQYMGADLGRLPTDYPGYKTFATQLSWTSVHAVLKRYFAIVQQTMAKIESFLEPIPTALQEFGIKRNDTVLTRISRHLISTCQYGYDPILREFDVITAQMEVRKEQRRQSKLLEEEKSQRVASGSRQGNSRVGGSPEL